jgi:hypothetical protein
MLLVYKKLILLCQVLMLPTNHFKIQSIKQKFLNLIFFKNLNKPSFHLDGKH